MLLDCSDTTGGITTALPSEALLYKRVVFFFACIVLTSCLCVTSELHRSQVAAGGDGSQHALRQTLGPLHGAATAGPVRLPGVSFMAVATPFKASCGERKTGDQEPLWPTCAVFYNTSEVTVLLAANKQPQDFKMIINNPLNRHTYSRPLSPVYTRCWWEIRVEFNQ